MYKVKIFQAEMVRLKGCLTYLKLLHGNAEFLTFYRVFASFLSLPLIPIYFIIPSKQLQNNTTATHTASKTKHHLVKKVGHLKTAV